MRWYGSSLLAAAALGVAGSAANAAVVYSDDFNTGTPGVALHGTAPDVRPGTETWTTQNNAAKWFLNGTEFQVASGGSANTAYLPYTVTSGNVYELSVKVKLAAAGASPAPLIMGFSSSATPNVTAHLAGELYAPVLFLRQNGTAQAKARGVDLPGALGGATVTNYNTLKLMLDTTAANWVFDAYINTSQLDLNGAAAGKSYTYTDMTNVQARTVAISNYNSSAVDGTFDDFSFAVVPEPASLGLLGLAAMGLARRRRA